MAKRGLLTLCTRASPSRTSFLSRTSCGCPGTQRSSVQTGAEPQKDFLLLWIPDGTCRQEHAGVVIFEVCRCSQQADSPMSMQIIIYARKSSWVMQSTASNQRFLSIIAYLMFTHQQMVNSYHGQHIGSCHLYKCMLIDVFFKAGEPNTSMQQLALGCQQRLKFGATCGKQE